LWTPVIVWHPSMSLPRLIKQFWRHRYDIIVD
jgi:hypothetical protein